MHIIHTNQHLSLCRFLHFRVGLFVRFVISDARLLFLLCRQSEREKEDRLVVSSIFFGEFPLSARFVFRDTNWMHHVRTGYDN